MKTGTLHEDQYTFLIISRSFLLIIMDDTKGELKCAQTNLQHSRVATANLMKYTADNKVDIICIQEPYIHQGKTAGIDTQYNTFGAG